MKLQIPWPRSRAGNATSKRGKSVLALTLEEDRLIGAWHQRANGSTLPPHHFACTLSLNILTDEPELVGREIRKQLDAAGIRERRCVIGLPLNWVLTMPVKVPDLSESDLTSFLHTEAERGFPFEPTDLITAYSLCRIPQRDVQATLAAVPRSHVHRLETILTAARLQPISLTVGISALQPPADPSSEGILALGIGERGVDLQITHSGGVCALRHLDGSIEGGGARRSLHADLVAREIRLTLGQMTEDSRRALRSIRIFGGADTRQRLAQDLAPRASQLGLQIEFAPNRAPISGRNGADNPVCYETVDRLAMRWLQGQNSPFEFLPVRTSRWHQLSNRFASRKLLLASACVGGLIAITLIAFTIQHFILWKWERQWAAIKPLVQVLEEEQAQIRQCRPWYDDSFRGLRILQRLTESFPEDGSVSARTIEFRSTGVVNCSGTARDSQSVLRTLDKLRASKEVASVQVDQLRGRAPVQFTFNLKWADSPRP